MAKRPFLEFISDLVLTMISKGQHFFNISPYLARKSSKRFREKNHWDFDDGQFDGLEDGELLRSAMRIV